MDESYLHRSASNLFLKECVDGCRLLPKGTLSIQAVQDGIVLPFKQGGKKPYGLGGVLDEGGRFIGQSEDESFGGPYEFDEAELLESDDEVLFLGYTISHWGTFLVDFTRRLWGIFELPGSVKVAFCGVGFEKGTFGANEERCYEFLKHLGLDRASVIDVRNPTRFKRVYVPQLGWKRKEWIAPEYALTFRKARESLLASSRGKRDLPGKVYLSRTRFRPRKEHGEAVIERCFSSNGFEVIHPETLSLDEQMLIFSHADVIASLEGTVAHNILFAKPEAKQVIIRKQSEVNERQPLFNRVVGEDATYIDCFYEPFPCYPISHDDGPFLLLFNRNLKQFLRDNDMAYSPTAALGNVLSLARYLVTCLWIPINRTVGRRLANTRIAKSLSGFLGRA